MIFLCREERLDIILQYLKSHRQVRIEEICSLCDVSRDTARRDVVYLDEQGLIQRTRGGARLANHKHSIKPYTERLNEVSKEKKAIGLLASTLIEDGDTLILDTSTTVQFCAENIDAIDCKIITNSINQAEILSYKDLISVYLLGGRLNSDHKYLYGQTTIDMLKNYRADKCFIGVCGISPRGVSIVHEEEGQVMKAMVKQSNQIIVLTDHTKLNRDEFFLFSDLSFIDILVTDVMPDEDLLIALKNNNIKLLVTEVM